ncbi:MAG: helix-turn-helix transcriptional regulator [Clostridiales bacterium]|nr:helix-turn-helix transcriptional regulator [Clostridiales bacterium]
MKQSPALNPLGHILPHPPLPFTSVNYFKRGDGWEMPWHSHEELQFLVVTSGSLTIHLETETQTLLPGDASLIPPGAAHALFTQGGYEQIGANVLLKDEQALMGAIGLLKEHIKAPLMVRCEQIAAQAPALLQMLIKGSAIDQARLCLSLHAALLQAVEAVIYEQSSQFDVQLSTFLDQRLGDKLSSSQVAASFHMSVSQLERLSHRFFGQGIIALYNQKRLIEAQVLLANSALPIGVIAQRIGFEDTSNFSAFFTRKTGLSPSAYRKRKQ